MKYHIGFDIGSVSINTVIMDATINPPDQIALGIAKCNVEYVPVGTAEKFVVEITSSPSGLSVSG